MFSKINVIEIITDHWRTLKNYGDSKSSIGDISIFVLFPILFSIILLGIKFRLNKELVNTLVTALSVFGALLFNLLMLIYDLIKKNKNDPESTEKELRLVFLSEIYRNISYSILISLSSIMVLLTFFLITETSRLNIYITFLSMVFILHFLLTGLMVLKRVHITLRKEARL